MKALLINNQSDEPVMEMGDYPTPKPGERELLVKVKSTALNRADLLQKRGKYPVPKGESSILGLEMSGVVESVGKGVGKFKKGDRVFGLLGGGGYAEYCTIHEEMAIQMPDFLSFEEAAAIPEVFLTAYQALIWLGELKDGETVLIHAGASGVGTAAIQLAKKLRKSQIAVTAGSKEKLNLCRSLGSALQINYKEEDFVEKIKQRFGESSVDLIVDFVGSPYWEKNISSLAIDGRLIYLSMLGGAKVEEMSLVPILRKRLTVRGSTLRNRSIEYKKQLTDEFWRNTKDYFENEELAPVISAIFDWKDVEKAHQMMNENRNAGKIVLTNM
ncbi:NAD(P)H-quinone oxidoreductase [Rhodohalobacter barkolensis]|uniref:NADPH:quinone oxidoreductase n=1 Tax=Rhodohalobacter barkolensis TaxID=2053187 RepID=A0A2N0VI24_9BACT|nr:NAD(P)H-quinone oxidoreductase [Rhodohalobacter barkolensis]PKD43841.1 NADPH:quinone oxidoreductase [Rhodohalobacter barkolensis]